MVLRRNAQSTRGDFIKESARLVGASVAGAALRGPRARAEQATGAGGPVVICRRVGVENSARELDTKLLREMVEQSILKLTGASKSRDAWAALFKPDDVVGIKVNMLGGPNLKTRPELALIIADALIDAGVNDTNIIIWDRSTKEMKRCGYTINKASTGVKVFGTDGQHDAKPSVQGSFKGRFSKILSETCTAIINVPILKNHGVSGMTVSMKNYYGAIDNPNAHHGNTCDPYIADLRNHPLIRKKERLIMCDALTACYEGGPGYRPQFVWQQSAIMVSTDPVALDRTGHRVVEAKRAENGLPTLAEKGTAPKHIDTAAALGLGEGDPANIRIVEV